MKKIIPSLFLTILANSSLLLAQNGNRLKATDQVTGCRLQVAGSKMGELPSEDQIKQGTKITTNYELPTTHCDNLGQDLSCHLMMDPAELKNIEEGTKSLEAVLGIVGKEAVAAERIVVAGAGVEGSNIEGAFSSTSSSNQVLRLRDEGSKSNGGKYLVNPSVECTRELANHQSSSDRAHSSEPQLLSSISYLPSPTAAAVSTAYSLQPTASTKLLHEAEERVARARAQEEKINHSWVAWASSKQAAKEATQREEAHLTMLRNREEERQNELRWGSLTGEQRSNETMKNWIKTMRLAEEHSENIESLWSTLKTKAFEASAYWNGEIEAGESSFSIEEATRQRDQWLLKAHVAAVKGLAARPCSNEWNAKRERANEMMELIRGEVWPLVSKAMTQFIDNPSEAKIMEARAALSAYAYVSKSLFFYASASDYAASYPSVSRYASCYASAYACVSAYASAYASAAAFSSLEAYEAGTTANIVKELADFESRLLSERRIQDATYENMNWSVNARKELAQFAQAIISFRIRQETEQEAEAAKSVDVLKDQRELKASMAEIKALATLPRGYGWKPQKGRADEMMGIVVSKVWPLVSKAMIEFIEDPNEARLDAVREAMHAYGTCYNYVDPASSKSLSGSASATSTDSPYRNAAADYSSAYAVAEAYASVSIHASAVAYATAYASATMTSSIEATETALTAIEVAKQAANNALIYKKESEKGNIPWIIGTTEKMAIFIQAVAEFKAVKEEMGTDRIDRVR